MTMRERIARAIDPERWAAIESGAPGPEACAALRAAEMLRVLAVLAVMRAATKEMVDAGEAAVGSQGAHDCEVRAIEIWEDMIDTIAAEDT